ncbi:MAG: hypothetical protein ACI865_002022 [Flavobacteriaceae bacterium]|jgi:hypothetical protein
MKQTLLLSLLLFSASAISQTKSIPSTELAAGSNLFFAATMTTTDITVTFQGPDDRWFAFGLGFMMSNADALIYTDGKVGASHPLGVHDYDLNAQNAAGVDKDVIDNWTITSNTTSTGTRTIVATRLLSTGDPVDHIITFSDPTLNLVWAKAGSAGFTLSYHGGPNRGPTSLTWVVPDLTPPALSGAFSPADNATGVSLTTSMVVNFNESIALATGNIELREVVSNTIVEQFDVATSGNLTVSGAQLTIDPSSLLASITAYYVAIPSGAIEDLANNVYAGFTDSTTWNFTTLDNTSDTTAPILQGAFIPADNATAVNPTTNLTATFNEDIMLVAGNITLRNLFGGAIIETFDVATSTNLTVTSNILVIDPTSDLVANGEYYLTIDLGAITDLNSNNFAGFTDDSTWNFAAPIGGINELEALYQLSFTTANQLMIMTESGDAYNVNIVSLSGQIIKKMTNLSQNTTIDLSQLHEGMVVIQLETSQGSLSKKVILH